MLQMHQKSIRTNDIENVGKTARHHTFFEMLETSQWRLFQRKTAIPFAGNFNKSRMDWF